MRDTHRNWSRNRHNCNRIATTAKSDSRVWRATRFGIRCGYWFVAAAFAAGREGRSSGCGGYGLFVAGYRSRFRLRAATVRCLFGLGERIATTAAFWSVVGFGTTAPATQFLNRFAGAIRDCVAEGVLGRSLQQRMHRQRQKRRELTEDGQHRERKPESGKTPMQTKYHYGGVMMRR